MNIVPICMCGSRTWKYEAIVEYEVSRLLNKYGTKLVIRHGDEPKGADEVIRLMCEMYGVMHIQYCASQPIHKPHWFFHSVWVSDWSTNGKAAGPIRNKAMLDAGIIGLVAFRMPGVSRGTDGMCKLAKDANVPVIIRELPE